MTDSKLSADDTGSYSWSSHLNDFKADMVGKRPPVDEDPSQLVDPSLALERVTGEEGCHGGQRRGARERLHLEAQITSLGLGTVTRGSQIFLLHREWNTFQSLQSYFGWNYNCLCHMTEFGGIMPGYMIVNCLTEQSLLISITPSFTLVLTFSIKQSYLFYDWLTDWSRDQILAVDWSRRAAS